MLVGFNRKKLSLSNDYIKFACIALLMMFFSFFIYGCCKSQPYRDSSTKQHARVHMLLSKHIKARDLSIDVHNGVLQVVGFANNVVEADEVEQILNEFKPNYKVLSHVKIMPELGDVRDNAYLKKTIRRKLRDEGYPVRSILLQVRDGRIMLGGFVNRHIDLVKMEEFVEAIPGVKSIENVVLQENNTLNNRDLK